MNKWKIAFWTCLATLLVLSGIGLYVIIDQSISLTYMKDGYATTQHNLGRLTKIINETDLSRKEIRGALGNDLFLESTDFNRDTIQLGRTLSIFKNDKLNRVAKQW